MALAGTGDCSVSRRLALEEAGRSSASSSQDTGEPRKHPTPPFHATFQSQTALKSLLHSPDPNGRQP